MTFEQVTELSRRIDDILSDVRRSDGIRLLIEAIGFQLMESADEQGFDREWYKYYADLVARDLMDQWDICNGVGGETVN
jgi:hypothetical protein